MAKKAASTEVTVEQKLRALYDLQLIDSRLDEIINTRGELPLEVEDLEADIEGLNSRIAKIGEEKSVFEEDIVSRKEAIKTSEALIKKYKKQQDNVRNNREFEALSKEIEYQELEIELSNKRIGEFEAKIEHKQEVLTEVQEKLSATVEKCEIKRGELGELLSETEKEESQLRGIAKEYQEDIEPRLLKAYEKIRTKVKNGMAVVSLERGAPTGSYFTLPPQKQMDIAQRKRIIIDEHSGRILVDAELAEEEKEKMADKLVF